MKHRLKKKNQFWLTFFFLSKTKKRKNFYFLQNFSSFLFFPSIENISNELKLKSLEKRSLPCFFLSSSKCLFFLEASYCSLRISGKVGIISGSFACNLWIKVFESYVFLIGRKKKRKEKKKIEPKGFSEKYECCKASVAVILLVGSYVRKRFNNSIVVELT